ncbi:MAG: M23 family metallopeptidase [Bacteroidetes bacterium]|nr:M23 family metallopeptidase [Bacteroidota bacterium]
MAKGDVKKRNWRDMYRFAVFNDKTFEEVWRIRLTRYSAFLLGSLILVTIIGSTVSLIAFTNLREFIPGYPDFTLRRSIYMNAIYLDSLERELERRDAYFYNINAIVSGREPIDRLAAQDTGRTYTNITFSSSYQDSLLRVQMENDERYNLTLGTNTNAGWKGLASIHFFPPVKGIVTAKFDYRTRHFGTDIVARPKALVSATLDGVVIFTGWTMETGFVIQVQHPNDIVSIYKHNAVLLKETGDMVRAGEAIAIIGDSGEMYTSGPHLHFEIWYRGEAVDPERYIMF